ncbi:MAG: MarR family transcriptional regulator [Parvularculaceae bacterium]
MYEYLAKTPERSILGFIDEVPYAFFRLSALAERLHADLGVSGPHRGVLKALFLDGEQTAPDLARRKLVTRQAIQPIVDDLVSRGLIAAEDNPRHRRSQLYSLTKKGIEACVTIQEREIAEIERLTPDLDAGSLDSALSVIRQLNEALLERLDAAPESEKA